MKNLLAPANINTAPVPRLDALSREMVMAYSRAQKLPFHHALNRLIQLGYKSTTPKSAPQLVVDRARSYQRHDWALQLKALKPGDSFEVRNSSESNAAYNAANRLGLKVSQRRLDGKLFIVLLDNTSAVPSPIVVQARQKSPHAPKRLQPLPLSQPYRPKIRQIMPGTQPSPAPVDNPVPPPDPDRERWLKGGPPE